MFPFFQILKRTVALGVSLLKRRWEILQWPITDYQHLFVKDNLALYFDWLTGFSGATGGLFIISIKWKYGTAREKLKRIVLRSKALACIA